MTDDLFYATFADKLFPNDPIAPDLVVPVETAISEGRRQLVNSGHVDASFLLFVPGLEPNRIVLSGEMNELMNSGPAKEILFNAIRRMVATTGATAIVITTDTWVGIPTEKQISADRAELEKVFRSDRSLQELADEGWCKRAEALTVLAQTAESVSIVTQCYDRYQEARRIEWTRRWTQTVPQSRFSGRQKMYGVKDEDRAG